MIIITDHISYPLQNSIIINLKRLMDIKNIFLIDFSAGDFTLILSDLQLSSNGPFRCYD